MKTFKKAFLPLFLALAMLAMVVSASAANSSVSAKTVSSAKVSSVTYNGEVKSVAKAVVTLSDGSTATVDSSDFTVKSSKTLKNAGKYNVTLTFKGVYTGTVSTTLVINKRAATVSEDKEFSVEEGKNSFNCGVKIADASGKVTASVPTGLKKKVVKNAKNFKCYKITVKKGFKGTKKIKFKISGTNNISTKSVTFVVKGDGKTVTVTKA